MKHRLELVCICSDSKAIFPSCLMIVSLSVSAQCGQGGTLCSAPLHTGIKGPLSTECFVMKRKPLVTARGELTIIGDWPNGKDGITGRCSLSRRNFSLPKKQERSQQRWLRQWLGGRVVGDTVCVQKPLSRLAEQGLNLRFREPMLHHLESAKNQGFHLFVAVDMDRQISCLHPLIHSCIQQTCMDSLYVPDH